MAPQCKGRARRVLLVDDSAPARTLLRAILSPFEWQIEEAADGASGFQRILETEFDLVITDLQMSPVGGAELIMAVMLLPHHRRPRIIVCTADHHASTGKLFDAIQRADGTIPKPITPSLVMATVLEVLGRTLADNL